MGLDSDSILGGGSKPDGSGENFQAAEIFGTQPDPFAWRFAQPTVDNFLAGYFVVPETYVGDAQLLIMWHTFASAGLAQLQFKYEAIANGEDAGNTGSLDETLNIPASPPVGSLFRIDKLVDLVDSNFLPGDYVRFEFGRLVAGDTLADFVRLMDLRFIWSTS